VQWRNRARKVEIFTSDRLCKAQVPSGEPLLLVFIISGPCRCFCVAVMTVTLSENIRDVRLGVVAKLRFRPGIPMIGNWQDSSIL
jgi:hypothetical protein